MIQHHIQNNRSSKTGTLEASCKTGNDIQLDVPISIQMWPISVCYASLCVVFSRCLAC